MGKGRVDPRKYGMSKGQVKGSWWFVVKGADGTTSMCHYSPNTTIEAVIRKNGGDPNLHAAKYGSKTLENDKSLRDYGINLNGSTILGDDSWDGKLALIIISSKGVMTAIRSKFSKKAEGASGPTSYDFLLFEATGLVGADKSGTSDPYVVFSFADGGQAKSSSKKKCLSASWGVDGEAVSLQGPPKESAELKIQVFDANIIQKDVLIGEAHLSMAQLYKQVGSMPSFFRKVLVPLSPQGWVTFAWKTAEDGFTRKDPLIFEPSFGFSTIWTTYTYPEWCEKKIPVLSYHSSLSGVIRMLEGEVFARDIASTPDAILKVAVQFGQGDSWTDLRSRFTPKLLAPVSIFALEVKPGHKAEEVFALLEVVKNSPSITEVHLLDFDQSDAMEHGIASLKGAPHVTKLKYSDDQVLVNDEGVKNLAELLPELPALEHLALTPSEGMLKSPHLPALLETIAGLKAKSVSLEDLIYPIDKVDLSVLFKNIQAESLALKFKVSFRFLDGPWWSSILESTKTSGVRKLLIDHSCLTRDATKQLVASVMEMPAIDEFKLTVNSEALQEAMPLLTFEKLKGLSVEVSGKAEADDFLKAVAANKTLERIKLSGEIIISQDNVAQIAKQNTTLKVLLIHATYLYTLSDCDPSVMAAFDGNTTMERAVLDVYKRHDRAFKEKIRTVAQPWKSRGAFFAADREDLPT